MLQIELAVNSKIVQKIGLGYDRSSKIDVCPIIPNWKLLQVTSK